MSNKITWDKNATFVESLKDISTAIERRDTSIALKEFVRGLQVFAQKTSIEFQGDTMTKVSENIAATQLAKYRTEDGAENFVKDFRALLQNKDIYAEMLVTHIGKGEMMQRVTNFATFLDAEFSKHISQKSNITR